MKFDLRRGKVLTLIEKHQPISVTKLAKLAELSAGTTIYRYIEELKERGLIEVYKEDQKRKRGNPTMLKTTPKAKPYSEAFYNWLENMKVLEK